MCATRIWAGAALLAGTLAAVPAWAQADYRSSQRDDRSQSYQDAEQADQYSAQVDRSPREVRWQSTRGDGSARAAFRYSPELRRATKLIGESVNDARGVDAGTIDDLVVDPDHGVVGYAIIARGGVLGVNERLVPVPFKALRQEPGSDRVTLQTDAALLNHVPAIEKDDYSVMNDPQWARDLYSQFNLQPYWVSIQRPRGTPRTEIYGYSEQPSEQEELAPPRHRDQRATRRAPRDEGESTEYSQPPRTRTERGRTREPEWYRSQRPETGRDAYSRSEMEAGPGMRQREGEGYREQGPMPREAQREPNRLRMVRASKIIDKKIEGADGKKIGDLDDLMVDMKTGGVDYAVVSEEKLFSNKLHTVPWAAVDVIEHRGRPTLTLDMAEADLKAAPAFEKGNWPDMASPRYTERIHRYYGVEPAWAYYGFVETTSEQPQARFEPQTVRTIEGTVQRMSRYGELGGEDNIVRLQLAVAPGQPAQPGATTQPSAAAATRPAEARPGGAAPGELITIYLAPLSHIREQGFSFSRGDNVSVTGSQVVVNGEPVILASTLTKEGKTLQLRNEQGEPLWTRGGAAPPEQQQEPAPQPGFEQQNR